MRVQRFGAVCVGLLLASLAALPLVAQSGSSTRSGVYTAVQAEQGAALYNKQCASCHGAHLKGADQNPPLAGHDFLANWTGETLADLYTKIQVTMPATDPGTLTPRQTTDLIAFLLKANQLPEGTETLPAAPATLKSIRIDGPKAKR